MNIIVCGFNWIGCGVISELIARKHNIFVFTHESEPYINSVTDLCQQLNIPYSIEKITLENIPFIPDVICSIYYKYIIEKRVIEIVNGKIFNLHPSILPKYKGCSSLTWAMINGEKECGFTYHYITEAIDCGKIILQEKVRIFEWDTQITLYHRVMFEALRYFSVALELVLNEFDGIEQDTIENHYYRRGCPLNGEINLNWEPEKIRRFIKAMVYPPLPYARIGATEIQNFEKYIEFISK